LISGILGRFDSDSTPTVALLGIVGIVLLIRVFLYLELVRSGYFYGIPWDTFSRANLAYQWAQHPYFAVADGYWVPLQFWIVGLAYWFARPFVDGSTLLIPVLVNNVFFVASLIITFQIAQRIAGRLAAVVTLLLLAINNQDIWITFSGLSEPILIFFVLCSMLLFKLQVSSETRRPIWSFAIGAVAILAAATHYVGWFLAIFLCGFLGMAGGRAHIEHRFKDSAAHLVGMLLCVAFPAIWLAWNAATFGDPLHFTSVAKGLQAGYVGQLSLTERILTIPEVFVTQFPVFATAGMISAVLVSLKKPRRTMFLMPGIFLLLSIWASTLLAFSAPYQEPRYLLIFIWILTPYTAAVAVAGLGSREVARRVLTILLVTGMAISGLWMTFGFENSFGPEVRQVARIAGKWLERHSDAARVIIEVDSFAEQGVIPVVSGHPEQFIFLDEGQIAAAEVDAVPGFDATSEEWLAIVKETELAFPASLQGLEVLHIGSYYVVDAERLMGE
jgi:hypothetical protein